MTKRKNDQPEGSGTVQFIPLNRLKKSPRNARTTPHPKADIEALAASIAAHGLLQSPVVEPEVKDAKPTGNFLVTIGEGRRLALLLRAKRKEIAKTEAVRCLVETAHDAFEISLAENALRTPMHPADQFAAFHALHGERGLSAEDIAARFGVTPAVVKQRLKLAAVSPILIEAYRDDEMSLDMLTAFALTDDVARQERVWEEIGSHGEREDIVAALTDAHIRADDPRAVFVGADAYQAAGGTILRDLFDEESEGFFADAELLLRLAAEKLQASADAVKAEGWKWVDIQPRYDHAALADCRRAYPQPRELTDEEQEKLLALENEYTALEGDDESETAAAEAERIEREIAALTGEDVWSPETIVRAGAVISIAHDGEPRIERGFIRPEDDLHPAKAKAAKGDGPAPLSEKLVAELTAHRTMALREAVGTNAEVALTAILHALAGNLFFHNGSQHSCLQISASMPYLGSTAPGIDETPSAATIAARHETWAKEVPDDPALLWDYVAALGHEPRFALLAHCVSLTIDAVQKPNREHSVAHAGLLTLAVGLDMTARWTPTAANYLGRVSKDRILEAVTEGVSKEAADNIAAMKKAAMAEAAEKRLHGRGWLPPVLRLPNLPAVMAEAAE